MSMRTLVQLCDDEGITRGQADKLIRQGRLQFVSIGSRKMFPDGAWENFIEQNTVTLCPEETKVPDYAGSRNAVATTSSGLKTVAAGSAARAQRIARSLKSRSLNSSTRGNESQDRAIQRKS